jgi:hypothetical protein
MQSVYAVVYFHLRPFQRYYIFPRYLIIGTILWKCFFFLSLNLLIRWQLSIWICCKPFFSLLYNCQLPSFWRPALSIVVEVSPRPLGKCLLNIKCVFWFSLQLLSETFHILRRLQRDIINVHLLTVILVRLSSRLTISTYFRKISHFMKSRPVGIQSLHAEWSLFAI